MIKRKSEEGIVAMGGGINRQTLVHGERTHLVRFSLDKGSGVPQHSHPHEQTGHLLSGRIRITINGQSHDLEPGDSWCIGSDVPHEAKASENATILELFSPPREDYL